MDVYALGATVPIRFTSRRFSTGAPFALAGTPTVDVYEQGSLVQVQTGLSVTADYDGVTGANYLELTVSLGNGYSAGKIYDVQVSAGTVDGVSVVGEVIYRFRLETAQEAAERQMAQVFEAVVIGATGNSPSALNLAAGSYADGEINEELGLLLDVSGGRVYPCRVLTIASDIATVSALDGTDLPITPEASVDTFFRTGAPFPRTSAEILTQNALALENVNLDHIFAILQLMARSDAAIATDRATELGLLNADEGSGAGDFDNAAEAQEALRDRGDAAWLTAAGFSTLDAAGVRAAIGMAAANLDTQLATIAGYIDTEVAAILADTGTALDAKLDTIIAGLLDADGVWDEVVEGSTTARMLLRLFAAALLGKASGLGTTAAAYRDLADTRDRISATVDADGNRTAVTLDAS